MIKLNWDNLTESELHEVLKCADKGRMYKADVAVLSKYCAMDADSTYQLWSKVFFPVCERYPAYLRYHLEEYITLLQLLIKQQNRGMKLDMQHLLTFRESLLNRSSSLRDEWLAHKDVQPFISSFKFAAAEKKWYRKKPEVYTKSGKISKNYIKWAEGICKIYRETTINPDSSKQLRELYYENIYNYTVEKDRRGNQQYTINGVTLDGTQSGAAPTDSAALRWFGSSGKLLSEYKDSVKQLSFVDKYLELENNGLLHPGWRVPGTLTGRLSGANPNLQQLTKTKDMLDIFIPRPGYKLVGADFASLENVVLAELSRDENLLKLYGPEAKENDGYLFFGSMLPVIGPRICEAGYDPENPTAEGISAAKKIAKKERSISKVLVLSDQYGAGAEKKFKTLRAQGVKITQDEVLAMHRKQQQLLAGLAKYRRTLEQQWERNNGHIISGYGRPLAVFDSLLKDLVNRDGQSTGHDCTMRWIYHINNILQERNDIEAYPFIVDFHDESIWEVKEGMEHAFVDVMEEACSRLNEELTEAGWICKLKIDSVIGDTLADVKLD